MGTRKQLQKKYVYKSTCICGVYQFLEMVDKNERVDVVELEEPLVLRIVLEAVRQQVVRVHAARFRVLALVARDEGDVRVG